MKEQLVIVKNRAGIHARPAALIVQTASKFQSKIMFLTEQEEINAKSIMGIITLGAAYNTQIRVTADGPDEDDALHSLSQLFDRRFEEH
jgi:phosphocarrier protein HPr